MNITLYHGSYIEIKEPLTNFGGKNHDFGKGFYLTNIKEQAESWAEVIATHKGKDAQAVVSVYNFDYFKAKNIGYRFNEFETYNVEWLKFVVECRKGKDVFSEYDIVIGGAINNEISDIVEDYEKGIITSEQAVCLLRDKNVNHQICILNQEIIEYCLEFDYSYIDSKGLEYA